MPFLPTALYSATIVYSSKLARLALLASLVLVGAVACRGPDSNWEAIQARGSLLVGLDASFPPFENVAPDGLVEGFDADFAAEIGRRLGLDVQFVNIAYDGLYDALAVGRADVLISALTVRESELARVIYTVPYFNAGDRLVVSQGSDITEMADMEGRVLAVEYGSEGDVQARAWQRRLDVLEIVRADDPLAALDAVESGAADAALVDGISARSGLRERTSLELGDVVREELYVAAVRNDNVTLLKELNAVIGAMIDDGTVGELIKKWF